MIRADCIAVMPRASWRKKGSSRFCPPMMKNIANSVTMFRMRMRFLRACSGKTGSSQRRSTYTKTTRSKRPTTSAAISTAPTRCCMRVTEPTTSTSDENSSTEPGTSRVPGCSGGLLGSVLSPMRNEMTPTGTLTRKIDPQPVVERRNPPMAGPTIDPTAATVASQPSACPRSPAGKVSVMMPWLHEKAAAPPSPWIDRAAMSTARLGAKPQSAEPSVNRTTPTWNTRTLP